MLGCSPSVRRTPRAAQTSIIERNKENISPSVLVDYTRKQPDLHEKQPTSTQPFSRHNSLRSSQFSATSNFDCVKTNGAVEIRYKDTKEVLKLCDEFLVFVNADGTETKYKNKTTLPSPIKEKLKDFHRNRKKTGLLL